MTCPSLAGSNLPADSRDQLADIARGVATEQGEMPEGAGLDRLLDAAVGLSRYEAEGAFSLSIVRHGRLEPEAVWELKTAALKKSGLLTLHRGGERFGDLGGLEAVKDFCLKALAARPAGDGRNGVTPRGILLLALQRYPLLGERGRRDVLAARLWAW